MSGRGSKRQYEREAVVTDALVVGVVPAGTAPFRGHTRNMSPGGVYVDAEVTLAVGSEVQLFIGSPRGSAALRTVGTVVHSEAGVGFGVRFSDSESDVDGEVRAFVAEFIKTYCKQP